MPSLRQEANSQSPALTLEEARSRIAPDALKVLEAKFNGSLAEVRAIDDNDQFF